MIILFRPYFEHRNPNNSQHLNFYGITDGLRNKGDKDVIHWLIVEMDFRLY